MTSLATRCEWRCLDQQKGDSPYQLGLGGLKLWGAWFLAWKAHICFLSPQPPPPPPLQDYYSEEYDFFEECFFDANGKPVLANGTASCDIKISGVDKRADKLTGGLDGVYQLTACYNGKALYMRRKSPVGEERVLWYSSTFGDWDVSKGTEPNEAEVRRLAGWGAVGQRAAVGLTAQERQMAAALSEAQETRRGWVWLDRRKQLRVVCVR